MILSLKNLNLKHYFLISICLLVNLNCTPKNSADQNTFRLHLFSEPQHLDPARSRSSSASYLFMNLMRGLYIYRNNKLQPEGGQCQWQTSKNLLCDIFSTHKWSDGSNVTSSDYRRSFLHLLKPESASPRAHLLFSIANSQKIYNKEKSAHSLGFEVLRPNQFRITFSQPDANFLYKLSSTALLPKRLSNSTAITDFKKFISTGPYTIDDRKPGQWIDLTPNPHFPTQNVRPPVRFFIVENDLTALRLYEKGKLDFLRRLPSGLIEKFRSRKDFFQVPMARFDYVGFGPRLKNKPQLRKALALSLNYNHFQRLLKALGRPGCPSLPSHWLDRSHCYPAESIVHFSASQFDIFKNNPLIFGFSQLGGDDVKKQVEWMEHQWKSKLQAKIELRPFEQGTYLRALKAQPPDIFRKGVGLDTPTCENALEVFTKDGRQNYIGYDNETYNQIHAQLKGPMKVTQRRKLCRQAIEQLMNNFSIIPLGEIHFSLMARPRFKGWTINEMNQLDLSLLYLDK